MTEMTHADRMRAVLAGSKPDRVPVALWRHFPVDDQDPAALAESTEAFQREYDFDLVKVTPASSFCIRDWGVQDVWEGNSEGTRTYTTPVIRRPEDWESLTILDAHKGALQSQLDCLARLQPLRAEGVPILQTVFNPLAQAKNLVGGTRWSSICGVGRIRSAGGWKPFAKRPSASWRRAWKRASTVSSWLSSTLPIRSSASSEYRNWGVADDRKILEMAGSCWLNMLHLHGEAVMFDLAAEYPVAIVNWHDRESGPSLSEGFRRCGKVVCGGWRQWETVALGDPEAIRREAEEARNQMSDRHLLLGTGCVAPIISPRSCLLAASRAGR